MSWSWNRGAMSTPPSPARIIVSTHANAEVRARVHAAEAGERLAVDHRPHLEPDTTCGGCTSHSRTRGDRRDDEDRELVGVEVDVSTPPTGRYTCGGVGPMPGHGRAAVAESLRFREVRARPRRSSPRRRATARGSGSATSRPIVPTMRAYTGAFASRRSRIRSSSEPEQRGEDEDRDDHRRDDRDVLARC